MALVVCSVTVLVALLVYYWVQEEQTSQLLLLDDKSIEQSNYPHCNDGNIFVYIFNPKSNVRFE